MTKLPANTLLKNQCLEIKELIQTWQKENYRQIILDLLENGENIEEWVKKIKELEKYLTNQDIEFLLYVAIEKAKTNDNWAQYILPALIRTEKINEEWIKLLNKFFKETAIEKAKTDRTWAKYVLPALIKTGKIDKEKLNKFFSEAIEKAKTDWRWANKDIWCR